MELEKDLDTLIGDLDNEIEQICLGKGFLRKDLEVNLHLLSSIERDLVLVLLEKKFLYQKQDFENKGGDLSNVEFFTKYRYR